jgi:hypothetical protein
MATQKEYEKLSDSDKKKEDWMNNKWRPMMGWIYMITCVTDFILFPILWAMLQAALKQPVTAWQPITLQGAGLFHLSMGAIIGIAAFGRTQEKLAGANNGGMQPVGQSVTTTYGSPSSGGFGSSSNFGASTTPSTFNSSSSSMGNNSMGMSKPMGGKSARFAEADPDSVFDRG